jgi:hypothetical protein
MSFFKITPPSGSPGKPASTTQTLSVPEVVGLKLHVPNPDCACDRARRLANRIFTLAEAPTVPLQDCGRSDCRCSYERIAERRKGERRTRTDRRDEIRFEKKSDRRSGKDRRKNSSSWKGSGV